jgi:hypothetical protein
MKKAYEKPIVELETFTPNEYIASCYAIVDVNNAQNFTIKGGGWNGRPTDGENGVSYGVWNWNGKGFDDDHFDTLDSPTWGESHNGLFYDGPGMTHTTKVQTWEANNDTVKDGTMVDHLATQVNIVELTDANCSTYNSSANAS